MLNIPHSLKVQDEVNIRVFPTLDAQCQIDAQSQLTIGDLHGNALKLLYFLVRHGVITNITPETYAQFDALYHKDVNAITADDIQWFHQFIEQCQINAQGTLRFVGDDLADRGANDYFTLKLFEKLSLSGARFEVLASNHGAEFVKAHEQGKYVTPTLGAQQAISMYNMDSLIQKGLVTAESVNALVTNHYKPALKALSYTFDEQNNRIAIFSHAPIGLNTIQELAAEFQVAYQDHSMKALAKTIDDINEAFTRDYVNQNRVHVLLNNHNSAFFRLLWNRDYNAIHRPAQHNGYFIRFAHGHDPRGPNVRHHLYVLDNTLGKGPFSVGEYQVHYTHERQLTPDDVIEPAPGPIPGATSNASAPIPYAALMALSAGILAAGAAWAFGLATTAVALAAVAVVTSAVGYGALTMGRYLFWSKTIHENKPTPTREREKEKNDLPLPLSRSLMV